MTSLRNYTRWRTDATGTLGADLLGLAASVLVDRQNGHVSVSITSRMLPDEARLIGVRLIEAAALADGDRAIREAP